MPETTHDDAVNALIADSASRRESTSKKTSYKKRSITSRDAGQGTPGGTKPKKPPVGLRPQTPDADARLTAFICGEMPLQSEDGSEHWHDPKSSQRYTLQDIAEVMGVSRERVRQIEQKALKKAYAVFSTMAHREGENAVLWFRQLFEELDNIQGGTFEHDYHA